METPKQIRQPFARMTAVFRQAAARGTATLSVRIITLCVGLFVVVGLLDAFRIVDRRTSILFLGLSHHAVRDRFWVHQFITAPLLHANLVHLLFNMLTLWMLGPSVETILGRRRYLVLTILCAAVSMAASFAVTAGTHIITLGYSGVIFGILVAQAVYFPNRTIIVFWFFPMRMRHAVLLFGAAELYLTIAPERAGVSHAAHLFGALAAYLYLRRLKSGARSGSGRRSSFGIGKPGVPKRSRRKRGESVPDEL